MSYELIATVRTQQQQHALDEIGRLYDLNKGAIVDGTPDAIKLEQHREVLKDITCSFSLMRWRMLVQIGMRQAIRTLNGFDKKQINAMKNSTDRVMRMNTRGWIELKRDHNDHHLFGMWHMNIGHRVSENQVSGFIGCLIAAMKEPPFFNDMIGQCNAKLGPAAVKEMSTRYSHVASVNIPTITADELMYDIGRLWEYSCKVQAYEIW